MLPDNIKDLLQDLPEDGVYGEQCPPGLLIEKIVDDIFSKPEPKFSLTKSDDILRRSK